MTHPRFKAHLLGKIGVKDGFLQAEAALGPKKNRFKAHYSQTTGNKQGLGLRFSFKP